MSSSTYVQYTESLRALAAIDSTLAEQLTAARRRHDADLAAIKATPELETQRLLASAADQALSDGSNVLAVLDASGLLPKKRRPTALSQLQVRNSSDAKRAVEEALEGLRQSVIAVQNHRKQQSEQERERLRREAQRSKDEATAAAAAEVERLRRESERVLALQRRKRLIIITAAVITVALLGVLLAVI